jgi:hypothetical protein
MVGLKEIDQRPPKMSLSVLGGKKDQQAARAGSKNDAYMMHR